MTVKRLYIGGLFPAVTESDLKDRFSKFGAVDNVEIKIREQMEGTPVKTFAYINLTAEEPDIKKCIKAFDRTKWKGSELTIQMAKENFLSRLIKERTTPNEKSKGTDENDKMTSPKPFEREIKGPPGTKVPGEDSWVVGKYGRVLPVVNLKKEGSRSTKKIDPSKFVHNVKKLDKDTNEQNDVIAVKPDELTWQLDVNENEVTKKRKGEFTDLKTKHKHRKSAGFNSSLEGDKLNTNSEYNDKQNSGRYNDSQSISSVNFDNMAEDGDYSEHSHKQRKSNKIKDDSGNVKMIQSSEDRTHVNQLDTSLTPKRLANDSHATKSNKKQRKNLEDDDLSTDIGIKNPTPIQKKLLSSNLLNDNINISSDYSHMKSSPKLKNSRKNLDYSSSDDSDFSRHEYNQSKSQYSNSSMQKYNSLNSSGQFDNGEDTEFEVVDPDKDVASTRTRPVNTSFDLKRFDSDDSGDDGNKALTFIKQRNDRNAKQGQRQKQNRSRMEPSPKKSLASLKKFKGTKMLQESVQTVPKMNVGDIGKSKLKEGKQKEKKQSIPSANVARRGNLPNKKMVDVGMFDTLNEFSSGLSAEQMLNRSPSSDEDEDDDDFFDYQDKTEPDRLLKPRNFTSNEYLGYVKESTEGINLSRSKLKTDNKRKESVLDIDRKSSPTTKQSDEETDSSDSGSEEENISQKGEMLDSGKIKHTNKHMEDSSSSDESDSEREIVTEKTSNKHNANKGKSQVSGKIQHTNDKIGDSNSSDDSESEQEIVNEKTSTKHQTNNVKTPESLLKTNKKSMHTKEQSDGKDDSSSSDNEENVDQKRGGETQKLVNKTSTNINTKDLSTSGSSDFEGESDKINKTSGEAPKLLNKTSGKTLKHVDKQSTNIKTRDSSSSSSSDSEEESDDEGLSSKEQNVGVIAKPRNSSLLKAGVTRFCNNTEEIRNVEQDKSDGKKLPSKQSNNGISKESDSDSSSGEDEPEVLPNNMAMDKQSGGDDSCSSESEMSEDSEQQTGAKYNKEINSKAIVQTDSESNSDLSSDDDNDDDDDDESRNRTKLKKIAQNDSSEDESSDEEIVMKKNSSTNPKSQNISMNNENEDDNLKSTSKGKESNDKLQKNSSTLMKSPKENKLNESTPKSNNDNYNITKVGDNKKTLKPANSISERELKTTKSKNEDRSIDITNSTDPTTDSVVKISNEKILKKDNSVKKSDTPKKTEDREKKGQTPSTEEVEQRRLAAVKQKHKDNLKQVEAVKNALANIKDGPKLNKKVVFDEDSDDDIYQNHMQISDMGDVQNYSKNDKARSEDEEDDDDNNDTDDSEGSNDSDDDVDDDDDDDHDILQNKASTKKLQMERQQHEKSNYFPTVPRMSSNPMLQNKSNQHSKLQSDSSSSEEEEDDDDDDDDNSDDDDDDEDIHVESTNETKQSGTQEQKLSLFDSSSSSSSDDDDDDDDDDNDDNDSDDEKRFAVRPQFEGSSGSKLLELQASYGSDKRFHLDERFAESDSDVEKETEVVDDNNDEKQNALKILESVVGHKVTIEKKEKKKKSNFK